MSPAEIGSIVGCVRRPVSLDGFSRLVEAEEIERSDWTLNPARYVLRESAKDIEDFASQVDAIRRREAERDEAAWRVDDLVAELREKFGL